MKVNYQKVTGFWVYALITPDGMFYIGMSGMLPEKRLQWYLYKDKSIWKYIEKYGWDNIRVVILKDGLTKEQALVLECMLIDEARKGGWCINEQRSGLITENKNEYDKFIYATDEKYRKHRLEFQKEYYQEHKEDKQIYNKKYYSDNKDDISKHNKKYYNDNREKLLEQAKKRLSTPEGKIYHRVTAFNHYHPDRVIETPKEAKNKYLEYGYIPSYIKNDDLK